MSLLQCGITELILLQDNPIPLQHITISVINPINFFPHVEQNLNFIRDIYIWYYYYQLENIQRHTKTNFKFKIVSLLLFFYVSQTIFWLPNSQVFKEQFSPIFFRIDYIMVSLVLFSLGLSFCYYNELNKMTLYDVLFVKILTKKNMLTILRQKKCGLLYLVLEDN